MPSVTHYCLLPHPVAQTPTWVEWEVHLQLLYYDTTLNDVRVQVECYEEIMVETINLCCYYYENNMYMVPKEKYVLLKVCSLWLCLYVCMFICACMCVWFESVCPKCVYNTLECVCALLVALILFRFFLVVLVAWGGRCQGGFSNNYLLIQEIRDVNLAGLCCIFDHSRNVVIIYQ